MLFALKKFIAFWLMPFPACVMLILLGWALARWTRRRRLGRTLLLAGCALLFLSGNHYVSGWLISPLEQKYPPIPELVAGTPVPASLAACRYVVVLGSGHGYAAGRAATHRLCPPALARITEGVRLLRLLPDAKLIVSGPADPGHESHASLLSAAAQSLGVVPDRIILLEDGHDTEEEAISAAKIVQGAPIALVTTAWHMPRSMALFHHVGLVPLPCPCDYQWFPDEDFILADAVWDRASIDRSTAAIHERIGYLWIKLRGKT